MPQEPAYAVATAKVLARLAPAIKLMEPGASAGRLRIARLTPDNSPVETRGIYQSHGSDLPPIPVPVYGDVLLIDPMAILPPDWGYTLDQDAHVATNQADLNTLREAAERADSVISDAYRRVPGLGEVATEMRGRLDADDYVL